MSKGNAGGMLGVGGTRSKLSRGTLRGGRGGGGVGGGTDPMAQRRALLRKLQEQRGDGQTRQG
ncbi:hypothetical protein ADK86_04625 [Streptomyces sp. NRRL F-5755]|uniref:DUF6243 family protein n=1 Tax=Streptomyces sp. NRRL F-5755 TaxID=1519475 RepID=UPI0006AE0E52|nr:DUF6243 family protein [Streptomyces sp. NRRL F-5755]KOU07571.1 hypothetical protein ADK86_04625 [Streptomyces sp. NRRL F-5755]